MKTPFVYATFFILLIIFPSKVNGQNNIPDLQNTQISILTCRSGDELYSTFGHTAIRILNTNSNFDVVYNYGIFSFNTPNFYLKFMRGKLPYYLGVTKTENFLGQYNYEKRSVIEQELVIDNAQKKQIIQFLIENAQPENREYKYDFFYDNCATRVVDVYSAIADIHYSNSVDRKTFRQLLKENLKNLVWSDFGIDIVIGARADYVADRRGQMFLPEYVMGNLEAALVGDTVSLAKPPNVILDFEDLNTSRKEKSTNWPFIASTFIFLLTLLLNHLNHKSTHFYNGALLVICGIMGILLLFMWFGTDHYATRENWNLLWLNPLILIYIYCGKPVRKVLFYLIVILLAIAALNCVVMVLPQFFNLGFLPLILSIGIALFKVDERSKNETQAT